MNETLERHIFNSRTQDESEKFDDFLTDVKNLSNNCNFCPTCHPGLVRDRIVSGIACSATQKKLLSEARLTLEKAVDICRANEKATEGLITLKAKKEEEDNVNYLHGKSKVAGMRNNFSNSNNVSCKFCGRNHAFGKKYCPAWGKKCINCGQLNHFAKSLLCGKQNYQGGFNKDTKGANGGLCRFN